MRLAPILLALLSLVACKDKEQKTKAAAPAKAGDAGPAAEPDRPSVPLPADPAALLPLDQKVKKGVLPNGMTYFIRANKEPAQRGEFRLVVNAGSFHEDDDQRGLAHFVEHMAFNGTKSFPKTELVSKLQQLGVRFGPHINAMTTFDETVYKLAVPTDKPESVDLTLQILREWAGDVTFLPADIDAERGVVLAEERDKLGAEMRLAESAIAQLFAGTRYANRLPIGLPAIIKKSKPDTLVRFYRDWYRPDNMAIIAVGDFDPAAIEKSIVERFGSLPKAEAKRAQPDRTMPPRKEMMFFGMQDKELPVAAVAVGQLVPARPHGSMNDFRREYVEGIAGLMLTKRLEEAKKKGDARYLVAGGGPAPLVRAAEAFGMFAAVKPEEMREGLEDVLAELERARRHGFTAGEAKRAADELISKMKSSAKEAAAGKEASEELAEELTRHFLTGEAVAGRDLELSIVKHFAETTKPEEMAAVISEMMSAKDLVMAAVAPAGKPLLSREDAAAELGRLPQKQLVAYTDVKSTKPLMAAPPAPGTVTAEKTHAEVGVTEWTLSNGARVFLKPTRFKADEILLRASSPGGFSLASLDSLKKTRVAHDLVRLGGLGEFDSVELEKILAGRDVEVQPFIDDLEEGLVASSSVDDVEVMLQLVNLSFTAPRLDKKAFEIWRESTLQEVRLARNKPAVRFLLRLEPLLANNDPRVLHWTEATVNGFDLDASFAAYKDRLQDAGDFRFVIVGSFELAAIKPLVLKYIGSLADQPRSETFALHAWPTHKKKQRLQVRDGKDERATLTVHFKRELAKDSVTVADRAAWSMFGEAMELELLELFREQMGDTYTVSATTGIAGYYQYATLSIGLSCAPDRAGKLEKLALAEIERMVSKGVGATYFDKARQAAIKELETSLENNQFWADRLTRQLFDGQPLADIPGRKKVLEGLTAEEVTRTAQRFVDPAVPVVGVHLPKR
jgi:zinc protease